MKKYFIALSLSFILLSCGGATMRTSFGLTEENLIKQVSIEHNCPVGKIKILESTKSMGSATYALEVCSKRVIYRQVGSVYLEKYEADRIK